MPALFRGGRLLVLGLIVAGIAAAWHWRGDLDPAAISAAIGRSPAAPLAFLAAHVLASLVFIPRTVLAVAAGLLFGMWAGLLWAAIGSVAGAAAGFLVARYLAFGIALPDGGRFAPYLERTARGGWRTVAVLRLVPVMPHSLANYGLGLTRIPLGPYAFGSLVGQLPMTVAYVELGAAGGRLMLGRAHWIEPTLIGVAALAVSLAIPLLARRRQRVERV
jgi:uncharacterized membrane protein YdjX (TVP38/TMEM64 family)